MGATLSVHQSADAGVGTSVESWGVLPTRSVAPASGLVLAWVGSRMVTWTPRDKPLLVRRGQV